MISIWQKSSFSNEYRLNPPDIISEPGFKFTQNFFIPLLKNSVKNDVTCEAKHHGIVISGPNTGGKTIFLKSINHLLSSFLSSGFSSWPAKEAQIFPYQGLFLFWKMIFKILESGLSSFFRRSENYLTLLENILPSNLILIDEIFNSTSSDEASALSPCLL